MKIFFYNINNLISDLESDNGSEQHQFLNAPLVDAELKGLCQDVSVWKLLKEITRDKLDLA